MTLKELLQVTDLSCRISVEECDPDLKYGRNHQTSYPDDLLMDLPEDVLNSRVFTVDYFIKSSGKVELRFSVINKEYIHENFG